MLKFAWRWAKVGDNVLVHDRQHPEAGLLSGVVDTVRRDPHSTQLGIRVGENGTSRVIWPGQACIHPDPLDPDESCTMCARHGATAAA